MEIVCLDPNLPLIQCSAGGTILTYVRAQSRPDLFRFSWFFEPDDLYYMLCTE